MIEPTPILTRQEKPKLAALAVAAAAISLSPLVPASNMTLTSRSGQPQFVSTAGNPLPGGPMVRIGCFENLEDAGVTIQPATATLPTVENLLSEIGTRVAAAGSGDNSDGMRSASNDPSGVRGDVPVQTATYTDGGWNMHDTQWTVVVYNDPDPANATEFGVFASVDMLAPPSSPDTETLATQDNLEALRRLIDSGELHLEPIPEPSGISLIMISLAIVIPRRRP